jgi:hypothetical protein
MFTVEITVVKGVPMEQNPSILVQKLIWEDYVKSFLHQPKFIRQHLRMSLVSFYKLLELIKEKIKVDVIQADHRGGPNLPETCLFCTLRWLGGGSYLDIYAITNVSISSLYCVVYKTLQAINNCPSLEIKFPKTTLECKSVADGFRSISTKEATTSCIGVIDGYLLRIYTPPKAEAGNV